MRPYMNPSLQCSSMTLILMLSLWLFFYKTNTEHFSLTWQYLLTVECDGRRVPVEHHERASLRRLPQPAETAAACQQGQMVHRTSSRQRLLQSQQEWHRWAHMFTDASNSPSWLIHLAWVQSISWKRNFHAHEGVVKIPMSDKVKVKFTLEQAMKAQRGSRGIALLFL